jgi:hypothetical protein
VKCSWFVYALLAINACNACAQEIVLRGTVTDKDSSTLMPFVYIISKSTGNGTLSDTEGKFYLAVNPSDTIIISYIGYLKQFLPVARLKPDVQGKVKLIMIPNPYALANVNVTSFYLKPYEREYMQDIIDRSKIKNISYVMSPFTALYMRFSREGKQIRKLARIFEDLMIEEEVQKKLSPQILMRLTHDEKLDYDAFRKFCYSLSDDYILSHDGAELYTNVMDCYKRWKREHR